MDTALALHAEGKAAYATTLELIRRGSIECDLQPEGGLKMAHRASRLGKLEAEQRLLAEVFACPTELLDRAAIEAGHFKGAEAYGALRDRTSLGLHPLKLANGILAMARGAGAAVHGASPVIGWSRDGKRHLLATPGGRVQASCVVVATNGYTPERLHGAVRGRLLGLLSNIVVTRPMTGEEKQAANLTTSDVMSDTRHMSTYFRRLPDDRIMLGGRGPLSEDPAAMARHRDLLLGVIKTKFPALSGITVDYFWGGWVCFTWDFIPHLHHAEDDASVHYALGYSGRGLTFAVHAGRRLAERLAGAAPGGLPAPIDCPLPRIPFAAFRRLGQRAMFLWYSYLDNRD